MAAENAAAIGISGTPTWLNTSQPPQQPRMRVANHAARAPNSRRSIHQKNTRKLAAIKATGSRGARSGPMPRRKAAPVIQ